MTTISDLRDKAALITGASSGIGAAVARAFGAQGARLALHFNSVGSIAGVDGGGAGARVYSTAKAAVHNISRHLARDLAKKKIRVNTVAPGAIATPFHARRRNAWRS